MFLQHGLILALCCFCNDFCSILWVLLQPFRTTRGNYITINLLESQVLHPSVAGSLTIYDGEDESYPVLADWELKNNTFYQGITSHTNVIYVVFDWKGHPSCKTDMTRASCIKFTIYLTAGKGECFLNLMTIS
jgi:hypothetical protein